jgi:hypothetical protein
MTADPFNRLMAMLGNASIPHNGKAIYFEAKGCEFCIRLGSRSASSQRRWRAAGEDVAQLGVRGAVGMSMERRRPSRCDPLAADGESLHEQGPS